jgi:RNA polymerase sigma-70 factor (ECF subfamily)
MDLCEDALQDACEQASLKWPLQGLPDLPGAWLHTVAKRKLIDKLRQNQSRRSEHTLLTINELTPRLDESLEEDQPIPDERLRLIFTCCHPAINQQAQVALTLKTLCGLTVKEIARAYLSSEVAMSRRITRAKTKIRDAGIAYEIPEGKALGGRLSSVLSVLYFIYNESYTAFEGQTLTREELAAEAIRLCRVLITLLPNAEVHGLLALMLFHNARRTARSSAKQGYIPLELQNRSLWNQAAIAEGMQLLDAAMQLGHSGSYQIQAAISALHCKAPNWRDTDWRQIRLLYGALYKLTLSPVILLNQAMTYSHAGEPENAYGLVKELHGQLSDYQPYYAARAELETKLQLHREALISFDKAISLSKNNIERDFLQTKLQSLAKYFN